MNNAPVSVVVLTYNRRAEAARTVERLLALPERPPLIVVDNASSDGTACFLQARYRGVRVLVEPRNRGAAGRNSGALAASTPYIAFCDDDTWWEPGALREAAAVLDRYPAVASLTARVLVGEDEAEDPTCALMARSPLPSEGLPGPALLGLLAGATVFRRKAFLEAGGYQPRFFLGGEESLLALDLAALGWKLVYLPALKVHHQPSLIRDAAARRHLLLRNALWTAWMRRPWPAAWQQTRQLLAQARRHGLLASAGLSALAGLPWALLHRRANPAAVERMCLALEAQPRP